MIIGLDVGGTHTDAVLLDNECLIREIKVHTLPSDLFSTVLEGLDKVTRDINLKKIKRVVLSTTLTTNSIIQGDVPEVGMIVSSGPGIDPELFRTNRHYYTVSGCIDHRGRRIVPVEKNEISIVKDKLKAAGIKNVGIVGKFSSRNPSHELEIMRQLKDQFENIFLGHRVSGNLNFPRRIATTFLNASVYHVHKKFFNAVKRSLDRKGLKVPIYILKGDGGTMKLESSMDFPAQTILSGPAASVMGAIAFAPEDEDVIVLDIGGTTTDMAILINRVPLLDPLGIELGGYKTLIRSLKTRSIGIGGDSVVRVVNGKLRIGPERLGFAMGYGGPVPTPTDAMIALGMIKDGDRDKSLMGLDSISMEIGGSLEETAFNIFELACKNILDEAQNMVDSINSKPVYTIHELREGYQVKPTKILVLGGPAPYFAGQLAKMSSLDINPVPRWKVANALGAALARTTCEVTLFADTERGIMTSPEENFVKNVKRDYSRENAIKKAYDLLRNKALVKGASVKDLEMELVENLQFNMVRGFYTTGKNIRIKAQVKSGLIHGYQSLVNKLYDNDSLS